MTHEPEVNVADSETLNPTSIGLDDGYAYTKLALADGRLVAIPSRATYRVCPGPAPPRGRGAALPVRALASSVTSLIRCASPPLRVGLGCPRLR